MSTLVLRTAALIALGAGLAPAQQETAPPPARPATPVEAALTRLQAASEQERPAALAAYITAHMATNALYAGQYAALRTVDPDPVPQLREWVLEAPDRVTDEDAFRQACVRALRDVIEGEAPEEVIKTLRGVIEDEFEAPAMRSAATDALAQLGDRTFVDKMIAELEPVAAGDDVKRKAAAWMQLADIYYNLRDYAKSAEAYGKLLALHEDGEVDLTKAGQNVPTLYYNSACSLALAGDKEAAFARLTKALEVAAHARGLSRSLLDSDMDIASLREDPRFAELMAKHFPAAPASAKKPASAK